MADYAGWTKIYDNVNQGLIQFLDGAGHVGLIYSDRQATVSNKRTIDWRRANTNAITARVLCDGPDGHAGCAGSVGWSSLFGPKLYLADDLPPTVGAVSGSVTTDTTWKGTEGVSYSAADLGGGVARLRLYVDGQPTAVDHVINTNNGHCQISGTENGTWVFSWPKPCPGCGQRGGADRHHRHRGRPAHDHAQGRGCGAAGGDAVDGLAVGGEPSAGERAVAALRRSGPGGESRRRVT